MQRSSSGLRTVQRFVATVLGSARAASSSSSASSSSAAASSSASSAAFSTASAPSLAPATSATRVAAAVADPTTLAQLDVSRYSFQPVMRTRLRGLEIVQSPLSNKGTGFSAAERDRLRIRGLVPPRTLSLEVQAQKIMHAIDGKTDALEKSAYLSDLQDRNETLFFRVLMDNLEALAPFVYTPTVGQVCLRFGSYFRRARGMYFSSGDRGLFSSMVHNWPLDEVEVVVVTDGSRILGLGDLGANGMGIPIGKLALYVGAGGIDPRKVMPVMLDLGTDNQSLLNDPWYLGMTHPRLRGDAYYSLVHEFVNAVHERWPRALIQFEDFSSDKAANILEAYRHRHLCFNDDIQGTGSVTLGALLAAVRTQGPGARLGDQRIVVCGAGSAGMGVCGSLLDAMVQDGLTEAQARQRFWVLDKDGLVGPGRAREPLSAAQRLFARSAVDEGELGSDTRLADRAPLLDVVSRVKPTILLGFTGIGGAFKEPVIREMARHAARPIIFPLSNPTSNAECTAEQAYAWTEGRAVFGGGSPFEPVTINGRTIQPSQINNSESPGRARARTHSSARANVRHADAHRRPPLAFPPSLPPFPAQQCSSSRAWAFARSSCARAASRTACSTRRRAPWPRW